MKKSVRPAGKKLIDKKLCGLPAALILSLAFMAPSWAQGTDLTPTLDRLHADDAESYPQTSSYTYVDNEDANTSFSVSIPILNSDNEITGDIKKYVNLKNTTYTVDSTPTLDRFHAQDPTAHPETSAYEYVTNPNEANTSIGVGTYTFDKATNSFVETIDKYVNIKIPNYGVTTTGGATVTITPTLDNLHSQDETLHPETSAYTLSPTTDTEGESIYTLQDGNKYQLTIKDGVESQVRYTNSTDKSTTNVIGHFIGIHRGGAASYAASGIYNNGANAKLGNVIGDFIDNSISVTGTSKYAYGGAINNTKGILGNVTGDFVGNSAYSESYYGHGGAIYNTGTIGDITGKFVENKAGSDTSRAQGGAILNGAGTIGNIMGEFTGNTVLSNGTYVLGGAIANSGTVGNVISDFASNSVQSGASYSLGGAIYNSKIIGSITGNFSNNNISSGTYGAGGAIYNNVGTIGNIEGNFISNNITAETYGIGGAIHNQGATGVIRDINANFYNNTINAKTHARGGAIANATATSLIGDITGDFVNNSITSDTSYAYGGAIYNIGKIGNIIGDFIENVALADGPKGNNYHGYAYGGAIYNSGTIGDINGDFVSNSATSIAPYGLGYGGAIYNSGNIGNIIGNFIENTSDYYGSAIYNSGHIGKIAGNFVRNNIYTKGSIESLSGIFTDFMFYQQNGRIGDIVGQFYSSTIYGSGTFENITGDFIGGTLVKKHSYDNFRKENAIELLYGATVKNITGDFIGNYIYNNEEPDMSTNYEYGAAIKLEKNVSVENIIGNFINNSVSVGYGNSYGGAISTKATIKNIAGDFIGNSVVFIDNSSAWRGNLYGAAIYQSTDGEIENITGNFLRNIGDSAINNSGSINCIVGDFIENSGGIINNGTIDTIVGNTIASLQNGGISNGNFGIINSVSGDFINNSNAKNRGGAIYNSGTIDSIKGDFAENSTNVCGGGIYNTGIVESVNGNFANNYALVNGGGIYNTGIIESVNGNFANNYALINGGGVYLKYYTSVDNMLEALHADSLIQLAASREASLSYTLQYPTNIDDAIKAWVSSNGYSSVESLALGRGYSNVEEMLAKTGSISPYQRAIREGYFVITDEDTAVSTWLEAQGYREYSDEHPEGLSITYSTPDEYAIAKGYSSVQDMLEQNNAKTLGQYVQKQIGKIVPLTKEDAVKAMLSYNGVSTAEELAELKGYSTVNDMLEDNRVLTLSQYAQLSGFKVLAEAPDKMVEAYLDYNGVATAEQLARKKGYSSVEDMLTRSNVNSLEQYVMRNGFGLRASVDNAVKYWLLYNGASTPSELAIMRNYSIDEVNCNLNSIVNAVFTNNHSRDKGGAIYIAEANIGTIDATFVHNYVHNASAVYGGAIYNTGYDILQNLYKEENVDSIEALMQKESNSVYRVGKYRTFDDAMSALLNDSGNYSNIEEYASANGYSPAQAMLGNYSAKLYVSFYRTGNTNYITGSVSRYAATPEDAVQNWLSFNGFDNIDEMLQYNGCISVETYLSSNGYSSLEDAAYRSGFKYVTDEESLIKTWLESKSYRKAEYLQEYNRYKYSLVKYETPEEYAVANGYSSVQDMLNKNNAKTLGQYVQRQIGKIVPLTKEDAVKAWLDYNGVTTADELAVLRGFSDANDMIQKQNAITLSQLAQRDGFRVIAQSTEGMIDAWLDYNGYTSVDELAQHRGFSDIEDMLTRSNVNSLEQYILREGYSVRISDDNVVKYWLLYNGYSSLDDIATERGYTCLQAMLKDKNVGNIKDFLALEGYTVGYPTIDDALFAYLADNGASSLEELAAIKGYRTTGVIASLDNATFDGNHAVSENAEAQGGAIWNAGFIESLKNPTFVNNYAQGATDAKGGAIYTTRDLAVTADNGTALFKDNYVQIGEKIQPEAIFVGNNEATLTLNAVNNGVVNMYDSINGEAGYDLHLTGDSTGVINMYGDMTNADVISDTVHINTANDTLHEYEVNTITGDTSALWTIDVNVDTKTADTFKTNNESSGRITLERLNILAGDFSAVTDEDYKVQVIKTQNDSLQLALTEELENSLNSERFLGTHTSFVDESIKQNTNWQDEYWRETSIDYLYGKIGLATTDTTNDSIGINITKTENERINTKLDTLAYVNQSDLDERTFDFDTENDRYTSTQTPGATGAGTFTVNGKTNNNGTSTIDLNGNEGFEVNEGSVLNINDAKITNGKTGITSDRSGGEVNLKNAVISGNKTGIRTSGKVNATGKTVVDDDIILVGGEFNLNSTNQTILNGKVSGSTDSKLGINNSTLTVTNRISGVETVLNNATLNLPDETLVTGGLRVDKNSFVNAVNNKTMPITLSELTMKDNFDIHVDVDLAKISMDTVRANNYDLGNYILNVTKINLLSDAKQDVTRINFADEGLRGNVATSVKKVMYSPIYKYGVEYTPEDGNFVFTRGASGGGGGNPSKDFNPAVLSSPVAMQSAGSSSMNQTFQYVFEHADVFTQLPAIDRFSRIHNNEYALSTDFNGNLGKIDVDMSNKGVWVRPYTSFDKTGLKNGPDVESISYGTIIGGDSDFRKLSNGWANVGTLYAGYFGSQVNHTGVDTTMNGGLIGLTETFYKGNFFTAITASVGAGVAETHTMYGKDDVTMLMAGAASKSGYNFEFKDGRFIIQPLMKLEYTMVNTFDYTNSAGVKIDADPLHTIQINPSVRFISNLGDGWQPYASVGMVWNLMNESTVKADGVELPNMHVKPYVEYGVGLQRFWSDKFSAFGQAMVRNGGRTGIAFTAGFRWALGKDNNEPEKSVKKHTKNLITHTFRGRKIGAAAGEKLTDSNQKLHATPQTKKVIKTIKQKKVTLL